jgi:hypothetical protein
MHDDTLRFPRLQVLTLPCREFHSLVFITANMKKKPINVTTLSLCHNQKTATFSTLVVSCNQNNTPAPSLLPWVFPFPSETSQQSKALDKVTLKWNFTQYKQLNMWNSISYACIQQKTKFTAATKWKAKQQMRDPTIYQPGYYLLHQQASKDWMRLRLYNWHLFVGHQLQDHRFVMGDMVIGTLTSIRYKFAKIAWSANYTFWFPCKPYFSFIQMKLLLFS